MNRNDILIDKYGALINVDGKTGKRQIRIVDALPDLQLFLNQTYCKDSDPLFPSDRSGRLTVRGVQNMLNRLASRAGIPYKVHPHSLRHGRLTELSNSGVSEMLLRNFAGWTSSSNMPAVYVNPTQKDLDTKLLGLAGVTIEEDKKPSIELTRAKTCPRCRASNPFDSKYCSACSMVLDQQEALTNQQVSQDFNELIMKTLMNNPAFGAALATEIAKQQLNNK